MSVEIKYNNKVLKNISAGETKSLYCRGMRMSDNLTITASSDEMPTSTTLGIATTDWLSKQSFPFAYNEQFFTYASDTTPSPCPFFQIGESYVVEWDGIRYECVGQDLGAILPGAIAIGNLSNFGGTGNGEPFVIGTYVYVDDNSLFGLTMLVLDPADTSETHEVWIYQENQSASSDIVYTLGEQTALSIALPADAVNGDLIYISFSSGETATTFSVIGTNVIGLNSFKPAPNYFYELIGMYNGTLWVFVTNEVAL